MSLLRKYPRLILPLSSTIVIASGVCASETEPCGARQEPARFGVRSFQALAPRTSILCWVGWKVTNSTSILLRGHRPLAEGALMFAAVSDWSVRLIVLNAAAGGGLPK